MKTLLVLAAACLAALALAPTAQADVVPSLSLSPCQQDYGAPGLGASIVVGRVCVDTSETWCYVWVEWTAVPLLTTCLIAPIHSPVAGTASAAGPAECMPVYSRTDVGHYSVVRRDSCSIPEAYDCPYEGAPLERCTSILGIRSASASSEVPWPGGQTPDAQCMDVYGETHLVGPYWLVRRDSCSAQLYECPEGYDPPAEPCHEAQVLSAQESAADSAYEPECLYVYRETEVGPVRQVSRDSCHTETYVCDQDVKDLTSTTPDPVALAQCTVDSLGLATQSQSQPLPVPPLADPTQRTCYRQGQGELQSMYCVQPEDPSCLLYYQQTTGVGSSWYCYPSGEHGSDW